MNCEKIIVYGIRLIFAGAALWEGYRLNGTEVIFLLIGLGLTFIPWGYEKIAKVYIPKGACLFYSLFVFGAQFLGSYIGFYGYFTWWDILLHLLSGILVGYMGLVLLLTLDKSHQLFMKQKTAVIAVFVFAIAVVGAVFWEIIEFTGDQLLGTNAQLGSLQDTMEDLICGTIVGGCFALYVGVKLRKKQHSCLDRLLAMNRGSRKGAKHKK